MLSMFQEKCRRVERPENEAYRCKQTVTEAEQKRICCLHVCDNPKMFCLAKTVVFGFPLSYEWILDTWIMLQRNFHKGFWMFC